MQQTGGSAPFGNDGTIAKFWNALVTGRPKSKSDNNLVDQKNGTLASSSTSSKMSRQPLLSWGTPLPMELKFSDFEAALGKASGADMMERKRVRKAAKKKDEEEATTSGNKKQKKK